MTPEQRKLLEKWLEWSGFDTADEADLPEPTVIAFAQALRALLAERDELDHLSDELLNEKALLQAERDQLAQKLDAEIAKMKHWHRTKE